jgi:hypothetical protein
MCVSLATLLLLAFYVSVDHLKGTVHHGRLLAGVHHGGKLVADRILSGVHHRGKLVAGHAALAAGLKAGIISTDKKQEKRGQAQQDFHLPKSVVGAVDGLKHAIHHPLLEHLHSHADKLMKHAKKVITKRISADSNHHLHRGHLDEALGDSRHLLAAHHLPHHPDHDMVRMSELDQFPTLQESFKKAKLVGLYFGASWCKECTIATEAIKDAFDHPHAGHDLLYAPATAGASATTIIYPLSIVFVSSHPSNYTKEKYMNYGSSNWQRVPFNSEEQTKLKQHFHACAEKEAEALKVDRKFGVPHLIILDSETRSVLTSSAVHDVEELGVEALNHFQMLQKLHGHHGLDVKQK